MAVGEIFSLVCDQKISMEMVGPQMRDMLASDVGRTALLFMGLTVITMVWLGAQLILDRWKRD